jgi:hypothetical protein
MHPRHRVARRFRGACANIATRVVTTAAFTTDLGQRKTEPVRLVGAQSRERLQENGIATHGRGGPDLG